MTCLAKVPEDWDMVERLCIFGNLKCRRAAELAVLSMLEAAHPGSRTKVHRHFPSLSSSDFIFFIFFFLTCFFMTLLS